VTVDFRCEPLAPRGGIARIREHLRAIREGRSRELARRPHRPPFDQLVGRMLSLSPTDRAAWFRAHGRALRRRAARLGAKPQAPA